MIKYAGMEARESSGNNNRNLPAGAYVVHILDAKVEGNYPDQRLAVVFDIHEGEFADWYMKKYNAQKERGSNYEIKYKGVLRLRIPNPENKMAQYPESDKRRFDDMIAKLTNSNPGTEFYTVEKGFDETLMVGKLIGVSVGWSEYNGAKFTKPMRFENVESVRNGTVNPIQDRDGAVDPTPAPMVDQRSQMEIVNTEQLPWDVNDRPY